MNKVLRVQVASVKVSMIISYLEKPFQTKANPLQYICICYSNLEYIYSK